MKTFKVTTSATSTVEVRGDSVKRYHDDLAILVHDQSGDTREVAYFRNYVAYREVLDAEGSDV